MLSITLTHWAFLQVHPDAAYTTEYVKWMVPNGLIFLLIMIPKLSGRSPGLHEE